MRHVMYKLIIHEIIEHQYISISVICVVYLRYPLKSLSQKGASNFQQVDLSLLLPGRPLGKQKNRGRFFERLIDMDWDWGSVWIDVMNGGFCLLLGGGNSNIFYFHPYLGMIPILTNIFQLG